MTFWTLWLSGWAAIAALMVLMWVLQQRTGNAGIVDVMWALGIGLLAPAFAAGASGDQARRWLIAVLGGVWALRLAGYLLARTLSASEDGRYQRLRREWGAATQRKLFGFFQLQAFWSVLFATPMFIAANNSEPLGSLDLAGIAIWMIAVAGESVADRQLARFRSQPENRGRVCRNGLWRYSRHPNYFFEWIHWWAYVLIGWHAPYGWATLLGPMAMLLFLFKITGIPPTEANALSSRGEAYREYQRETSVFFPWPPKEGRI